MNVTVQEAATDRHPVLDKHLLDKKGQIYTSCKLQIIYKQNGNSQQAALRHSKGAWNHITTHFVYSADSYDHSLTRNLMDAQISTARQGIFVSGLFDLVLLF